MPALLLLLCVDWPAAEALALRRELARFPPAAVAEANVAFADAHLAWLDAQLSLGRQWRRALLLDRQADTRCRRACWRALADAHGWAGRLGEAACWDRGTWCRYATPAEHLRDALARLRHLLGPTGWAFGELPAPADFARFSRAD